MDLADPMLCERGQTQKDTIVDCDYMKCPQQAAHRNREQRVVARGWGRGSEQSLRTGAGLPWGRMETVPIVVAVAKLCGYPQTHASEGRVRSYVA